MKQTMRDRIVAAMDTQRMSAAELSRRSGVSYNVITKLRHRPGSSTSAENAMALLAVLEGVKLPSPHAGGEGVVRAERAPPGADLVPVYDISASAGDGAVVLGEEVSHTLAFPPGYLRTITRSHPCHLAIISVKGDSMEPTLRDDDIVMLDMSKTDLGYEGLFCIRIYDVLHIKRLSHARPGYVEVISDNRAMYPPREYPLGDVEVVGKVLWAGGKI